MSHPSKVDILARAQSAGFFTQLFFVGTDDPQTNVDRVALRVAQGGHDVPQDRIVARWTRTMELLRQAIAVCDDAFVFDNSAAAQFVASPRLVFCRSRASGRVAEVRQFAPMPVWVRRYVLVPLQIDPVSAET